MKPIFVFQDTTGDHCSVYAEAELRDQTIALYEVNGDYVVDGTSFGTARFTNLEDASIIFNNQDLVIRAKRLGRLKSNLV